MENRECLREIIPDFESYLLPDYYLYFTEQHVKLGNGKFGIGGNSQAILLKDHELVFGAGKRAAEAQYMKLFYEVAPFTPLPPAHVWVPC